MQITIVASRHVFEAASSLARSSAVEDLDGMASIVNSAWIGRIEEVWDSIEKALKHAFEFGRDKASDLMTAAVLQTENLLAGAGEMAKEVQDAILQRLNTFTNAFIQGMLARVPTSVGIGGVEFALGTVKLNQKLVATGSLKTNLAEVFSLAANGEIEVGAEYSMSTAAVTGTRRSK
jgi:hypothetical protein